MDTNSAKSTANQEAGRMKSEAQEAASELGSDIKDQARGVTDEATAQAKSLASSVTEEVSAQAATQQERLAGQSRIVSDDLQRIARGERAESEMVNKFISQAAGQAQRITEQLESREPKELLDDVRSFAARRPGMFFAIAAGLGIAAGRLTRGLRDSDDETAPAQGHVPGEHSTMRAEYRGGTVPHLESTMDLGGETAPAVDPIGQAPRHAMPEAPVGSVDEAHRGLDESGRQA